jgi:predicted nucleic acid-binding protein
LIVIDACAVAEILVDRRETRDGLRATLPGRGEDWLHAPELLDLEVLSVLRGWARAGAISARRGLEAVDDLARARVKRYPHGPFRRRIWALRDELSAYDAAYLALAEGLDATLLTSDAGLAARARVSLGDARVRQFA